jgi:hypothetical protein
VSGRRLAIVLKAAPALVPEVLRDIELEFAAGPTVQVSVATGRAGSRVEELVASARSPLRTAAR